MQALLRFAMLLVGCVLVFFESRMEQVVVDLALRQQLAAYTQRRPKPRLTSLDRAFWIVLHRPWPRWKEVLVIVKPETVTPSGFIPASAVHPRVVHPSPAPPLPPVVYLSISVPSAWPDWVRSVHESSLSWECHRGYIAERAFSSL